MPNPRTFRLATVTACLTTFLVLGVASPAAAFKIQFANTDLAPADVVPQFSSVRDFQFEIDFAGPLVAGQAYDNGSLSLVQYVVRGSLASTPSGFSGFRLDRTPTGEGPITPAEWVGQGSSIAFEIAASANLLDGLQLAELVPDSNGLLFRLDAREFERLDRARYHPPLLTLFANGMGTLQNSNNSSGNSGTTNPGNNMLVNVDFGEEYITNLQFDPNLITLVVPEPGTALLLGLGIAGLTGRRGRIDLCPPPTGQRRKA